MFVGFTLALDTKCDKDESKRKVGANFILQLLRKFLRKAIVTYKLRFIDPYILRKLRRASCVNSKHTLAQPRDSFRFHQQQILSVAGISTLCCYEQRDQHASAYDQHASAYDQHASASYTAVPFPSMGTLLSHTVRMPFEADHSLPDRANWCITDVAHISQCGQFISLGDRLNAGLGPNPDFLN